MELYEIINSIYACHITERRIQENFRGTRDWVGNNSVYLSSRWKMII